MAVRPSSPPCCGPSRSFTAARLAEPGEFARRAFANGKLDLTEVEGLADFIEAETEGAAPPGASPGRGRLGPQGGVPGARLCSKPRLSSKPKSISVTKPMCPRRRGRMSQAIVVSLIAELRQELAAAQAGERLRDGLTAVIAGPPNAGKSTLLNALARREAAIVSAIPGTTRDAIEVHLDLDGLPLTLIDTAGLRDSDDPIEAIGIARTKAKRPRPISFCGSPKRRRRRLPALDDGGEDLAGLHQTRISYGAERAARQDGISGSARRRGENMDLLVAPARRRLRKKRRAAARAR